MAREATASFEKVILLTNASGYLFLFNLIGLLHVLKISYWLLNVTDSITLLRLSTEFVAPYSFVGEYQRFEGIFCLYHQSRPWRLHGVTTHKKRLKSTAWTLTTMIIWNLMFYYPNMPESIYAICVDKTSLTNTFTVYSRI